MKVAVLGANGQLGADVSAFFAAAGHEIVPLTHGDLEIVHLDAVRASLGRIGPDLVVNTAAMHHVEICELEPGRSYEVNAIGARNLALAAVEREASLMQVSTDYVFDGHAQRPYVEADAPGPLNVYGSTKLAGEVWVRALAPRHAIVRTSGLYGRQPCRAKGPNFVDKMLQLARTRDELRVVDDEVLSPTSTLELSRQMLRLAERGAVGLFHATAVGSCSWYEFAAEILRLTGTGVRLERARPGEFPAKVARPAFSALDDRRLRDEGLLVLRPWQDGLREYLEGR